jgi:hypothetical protein
LAIYDEKSYYMQLRRELDLMRGQQASDKRKMTELNSLNEEIRGNDQTPDEVENSKKFVNYKDCRPSA